MKILIKNARASWPSLFVATAHPKNPESRSYKIDLMIPKSDKEMIELINRAVRTEAQAKFGDNYQQILKNIQYDTKANSVRDGDIVLNKKGEPIALGCLLIAARRSERDGAPVVRDQYNKPVGRERSDLIYAGCYVNASVEIYAQNKDGNSIRCSLLGVQFAKDGQSFGGAAQSSGDEFEAVVDEENFGDI